MKCLPATVTACKNLHQLHPICTHYSPENTYYISGQMLIMHFSFCIHYSYKKTLELGFWVNLYCHMDHDFSNRYLLHRPARLLHWINKSFGKVNNFANICYLHNPFHRSMNSISKIYLWIVLIRKAIYLLMDPKSDYGCLSCTFSVYRLGLKRFLGVSLLSFQV